MIPSPEIYSDRSRVLTAHQCLKKRLLEYELPTPGGLGGVVPIRLNMDLVVGGAFHRGIQSLLLNHHVESPVLSSVDDAVRDALEGAGDWPGYWPLVKSRGLSIGEKEDVGYVYYEQASLVEALVRGYEAFVLPQLLERFVVVEVEREDLGTFKSAGSGGVIKFGMRADALLMEKDSLDLYVLSLKTTKEWGKKMEDTFSHDMQGLSEVMVVEERLKEWHNILLDQAQVKDGTVTFYNRAIKDARVPQWFLTRFMQGSLPLIMGITMHIALKGRKSEYPQGSGVWSYSNPLIRPWKKADDLGGVDQYAFLYEYQDPMGGNHRLGKGWRRVNIWEDMGVKEWVEVLKTQSLQGMDPMRGVSGQFVLPQDYYRNEEDMKDLQEEIVGQEETIAEGVRLLREALGEYPQGPDAQAVPVGSGAPGGDQEGYSVSEGSGGGAASKQARLRWILGKYFRKQTKSCDWPTKCEYQPVCFGPREYTLNPISSELYQIRTPNHPIEEAFKGGVRGEGV